MSHLCFKILGTWKKWWRGDPVSTSWLITHYTINIDDILDHKHHLLYLRVPFSTDCYSKETLCTTVTCNTFHRATDMHPKEKYWYPFVETVLCCHSAIKAKERLDLAASNFVEHRNLTRSVQNNPSHIKRGNGSKRAIFQIYCFWGGWRTSTFKA